jgi:hypothetical protein
MALLISFTVTGPVGLIAALPAVAAETSSREMGKELQAAQAALKARRYDEAIAKLKGAEALGKKTPSDQHIINVLSASAYYGKKDYGQAVKYYEAQLEEGSLKETEQQQVVKAIATLSYDLKNYDKAIEYGNRAIKGNYADQGIRTVVIQSYYEKSDWKSTRKGEEELISGQLKKGETPKQDQLELLVTACGKLEDGDCQTRAFETLVQYYPKPEYWENLLYGLQKGSTLNDRTELQLYRLMLEVNVLKRADRYTEMAQLTLEQGSPGEAQHILEKGFDSKVFTDQRQQDKNRRLLESAKKAATSRATPGSPAVDLASLPEREKAAESAASGDDSVSVGNAYLGYQQYDKAAANLSRGLAKGVGSAPGSPSPKEQQASAQLLLGIAQLKGGHKDDALKSFRSVKGDPMLERIANLWALRAKQPAQVAGR